MLEPQFKGFKTPIMGLILGIVIGLIVAIVLGGVLPWRPGPEKPDFAAANDLPRLMFKAPNFKNFKNQLGDLVSSSNFSGKVLLVTFMYPKCTHGCPILASRMTNLETLLRKRGLENRVALITFNVDPNGGNLEEMQRFMAAYGADPENGLWQFLTASPDTVATVVKHGYHANFEKLPITAAEKAFSEQLKDGRYLPVLQNPLKENKPINYEIYHDASAVIVGPDGYVRYVLAHAYMDSEAVMMNDIIRVLQSDKGI